MLSMLEISKQIKWIEKEKNSYANYNVVLCNQTLISSNHAQRHTDGPDLMELSFLFISMYVYIF